LRNPTACPHHGTGPAIRLLQTWNALRVAAPPRHSHPWRRSHLRHMDSATSGASDVFELDQELKPSASPAWPPDYFSPWQRWVSALSLAGSRDCRLRLVGPSHPPRLPPLRHRSSRPLPGFEAYWAIPAKEETAINGEWSRLLASSCFTRSRQHWARFRLSRRPDSLLLKSKPFVRNQEPGMKSSSSASAMPVRTSICRIATRPIRSLTRHARQ